MTTLYLATGDGPVIVTRRGARWRGDRPLDVRSASCIAYDPQRPERVFVATNPGEQGVFYVAGDAGLYQSSDAGAEWQRLDVDWPDSYQGARIHMLAVAAAA